MDSPFDIAAGELMGRRVKLVACDYHAAQVKPGDTGTVRWVDAVGIVHVNWDNGAQLGLVEEAGDLFELLPDAASCYGAQLAYSSSML